MDQSDDEFFSPIYMLKNVLVLVRVINSMIIINIEDNAMAASKKREKKRQRKRENEWHAINIEDQQYFEQFLYSMRKHSRQRKWNISFYLSRFFLLSYYYSSMRNAFFDFFYQNANSKDNRCIKRTGQKGSNEHRIYQRR